MGGATEAEPGLLRGRWLSLRQRFARTARRLTGAPPVIVYQMAKVGSTAIVEALARHGLAPLHLHRMNREHLQRRREIRRSHGWFVPPIPPHDRLGPRVFEKVIRAGRPVLIVTLVREPISRNLSSYFEHLDAIWKIRDAHEAVPLDELCRGFMERYTHEEPLTWFDDEMLPVLGIDVYEHPFPAVGHQVIRTEHAAVLILKSEIVNATKGAALSHFFGIDGIEVRSANGTAGKSVGDAFRRFTSAIRLPSSYVDTMVNARYTRHFYSDREREAITARWARPGVELRES